MALSGSSLKRSADDGVIQLTDTAGGHGPITIGEAIRFVQAIRDPLLRPDLLGLSDPTPLGDDAVSADHPADRLLRYLREGKAHKARALVLSADGWQAENLGLDTPFDALLAAAEPSRFRAIAAVDPVDGAGSPLGNQPRVVQERSGFEQQSLVISTERGEDCAPAGDNYVQFYGASPSPAWHVVPLGQGHGDTLNETEAAAAAMFCPSGSDRAGMRRLTAGLFVSCFRAAPQEAADAYGYLTEGRCVPLAGRPKAK